MKARQRFRRPRFTSKGKRSKFEDKVQDLLEKKKVKAKYEHETIAYQLDLSYKPDWTLDDGTLLEAKGRFDYIERRKILAVKRSLGDRKIHVIFMRDQKISKNSKTTYTAWCAKHEISCSVYPELPL